MTSDFCSVGCIIMDIYTRELLFQTHENYEHLAVMVKINGEFPKSMVTALARHSRKYFDSSNHLI